MLKPAADSGMTDVTCQSINPLRSQITWTSVWLERMGFISAEAFCSTVCMYAHMCICVCVHMCVCVCLGTGGYMCVHFPWVFFPSQPTTCSPFWIHQSVVVFPPLNATVSPPTVAYTICQLNQMLSLFLNKSQSQIPVLVADRRHLSIDLAKHWLCRDKFWSSLSIFILFLRKKKTLWLFVAKGKTHSKKKPHRHAHNSTNTHPLALHRQAQSWRRDGRSQRKEDGRERDSKKRVELKRKNEGHEEGDQRIDEEVEGKKKTDR